MADPLGKKSLPVQSLRLAHLHSVGVKFLKNLVELSILRISGEPSGLVIMDGLYQLAKPQLHVMEVWNSLSEGVRDVGQHGLEMAESLSRIFRVLGIDCLVSLCAVNEHGNSPELPIHLDVGLGAVLQRDESEHLPVYVSLSGGFQLTADVPCSGLDVILEQLHVGENGIVNPLQDIIRRVTFCRDFVGVINQSVPQRGNLLDLAFDGEAFHDLFQVFHHIMF